MTLWDKIRAVFAGDVAAQAREFFEMRVEDVFPISGRGVVVTGRIAAGVVRVGDPAVVRSESGEEKPCRVAGIETSAKGRDGASAGENAGVLLSGVRREDIRVGDTLRSSGV